jgi:hypothetical protein
MTRKKADQGDVSDDEIRKKQQYNVFHDVHRKKKKGKPFMASRKKGLS